MKNKEIIISLKLHTILKTMEYHKGKKNGITIGMMKGRKISKQFSSEAFTQQYTFLIRLQLGSYREKLP